MATDPSHARASTSGPSSRVESTNDSSNADRSTPSAHPSRPRRGSRPDLSFLGIGGSSEHDVASLEARRENKQERETRRIEKERIARLMERERSMREEHVDGGYLVTQGVYVGPEDYNKSIVRQLMVCVRSFYTEENLWLTTNAD